jgi:hypothetical protein
MDVEASGMDFAERLGLWLNAFDAIGLQAELLSIKAIKTAAPGKPTDARPTRAQAIDEDFQRVRTALANAIAQDLVLNAASAGDAAYSPYRQRHLELQRRMELMIAPLRDHVRQALCRVSPMLRQLAALDAVLEQVLAPRGQMLLPTVAALMERRFEQLRLAHRQELEAAGQQDDPALWRQSGGWLDVFGKDWRQALSAEMDLRLEPVAGLIEALSNELKNRQ